MVLMLSMAPQHRRRPCISLGELFVVDVVQIYQFQGIPSGNSAIAQPYLDSQASIPSERVIH